MKPRVNIRKLVKHVKEWRGEVKSCDTCYMYYHNLPGVCIRCEGFNKWKPEEAEMKSYLKSKVKEVGDKFCRDCINVKKPAGYYSYYCNSKCKNKSNWKPKPTPIKSIVIEIECDKWRELNIVDEPTFHKFMLEIIPIGESKRFEIREVRNENG